MDFLLTGIIPGPPFDISNQPRDTRGAIQAGLLRLRFIRMSLVPKK